MLFFFAPHPNFLKYHFFLQHNTRYVACLLFAAKTDACCINYRLEDKEAIVEERRNFFSYL